MNKIKKGDTVVVLSGKDKGRSGTVLEMVNKTDRVLVQGVNMVKRQTKQSQTS
ncbi:MAG: 50S ribosomal protein L24, partial [Pseudomonadota bacterium]